jgi:formylglycine-generating enzyme required for sulfatase activity
MYPILLALVLFAAVEDVGAARRCAADAVQVGPVCVDKYEASIWSIPVGNTRLVAKVRNGTASMADLERAGATLVTPGEVDYDCFPPLPSTFPATGDWTEPLYAVSVAGVLPAACVTWFQAEQACRLSGKRLLTNQEWQAAAAGTPDVPDPFDETDRDCNTYADNILRTGQRVDCVSRWGANDMIGNVSEWVADWMPMATTCSAWTWLAPVDQTTARDEMCVAGASTTEGPGALIRGSHTNAALEAGKFAVSSSVAPSYSNNVLGFRCGR